MKDWRRATIIPSFSGGKDSTYLVLRLHELGIKMTDIVYFDTGWEFPHMEAHIAQVEDIIKQKITRLVPRESFDFIFARKARTRNVQNTRRGYGWPSAMRRWCTGEKTRAINAYVNSLTWQGITLPAVQCLGYASDEPDRVEKHKTKKAPRFQCYAYPMVEWGIFEGCALAYCRERGLSWGGLYDIFDRVSCWCCPLGGIANAEKLYRHFPAFWQHMLEMESWLPEQYRQYAGKHSVSDLDKRFYKEDFASLPNSSSAGLAPQPSAA
ncbi:phosphoadenosine phosphosulfate reductase family protein [Bilophila wadsworthia]|jgi:3'-phosphoadenosine 5'-phosphosulfate sulfotransferase (PAPS reductase)/FAD synthetase|uniref:phosphoadenosine phosphosulfate reductase domain-containing protein n=1 Tax=Bilophila wadsworthia TaxID=35833 RepID=UPI001D0BC59E|nr:phosphoadenosine phosphosulfate reductase family protein [Bilophila wadsworthia]MCB8572292.1 phosphoadenosine phosphosulfate reductase family protein [Bilophila wadsworthia]MCC2715312.1 phosphoadenosine phosphosulfate reductase family protein [Bilophila wadsworthia]